jgi:hypothetical protein
MSECITLVEFYISTHKSKYLCRSSSTCLANSLSANSSAVSRTSDVPSSRWLVFVAIARV